MAHTEHTSWECRDSGTATGGAGFDPSFGGTDYSQSDAPILTHADGVISGTNLQSTLGGFTAPMAGNSVYLSNSQTWRQITAFVNANNVTLETAPANTSGNTFNVGGAFKMTASGFAFPYQPGNVIWWRGTINPSANGPSLNCTDNIRPVVLRGYSVTRGDGGFGTLVGGSVASQTLVVGSNCVIENMIFDGNNTQIRAGLQLSGTGATINNCKVIQNTSTANGVEIIGSYNALKNCFIDVHQTTGHAVVVGAVSTPASGCVLHHNVLRGNSAAFVAALNLIAGSFVSVQYNVIFGQSGDAAIWLSPGGSNWSQGANFKFNTIANNKFGLFIDNITTGLTNIHIEANIFSNNSANDILFNGTDISGGTAAAEWSRVNIDTNAFFTVGTRYSHLPASPNDVNLMGSPFVDDTTTFNFQLNNTVGAGAACQGAWRLAYVDGVNTGVYSLGALGAAAAVAAAALAFNQAAPAIDETLFPIQISRMMVGGPSYSTVVTATGGGAEQRVGLWARPRYKWEINNSPKQPSEMQAIINFFHAREGRLRGFRFQDWSDFSATNEPLIPTGSNTVQLIKTYTNGPSSTVRNIYKPKASPAVTLLRNGSPFAAFSLDTTTGLISPTADSTASITAITKAAAALVTTSAAHGFTVGQTIYFSGVLGMTQINGLTGVVQTTPLTTTFTLNVNSTAFSTYTSAGTASRFVQPGETLVWTGQFDTPVRFDVDELRVSYDDPTSWSLDGTPIVEIRP